MEDSLLGAVVKQPYQYTKDLLRAVPFVQSAQSVNVTLECDEFTSLCPVTGQPDYAWIIVFYTPAEKIVETKSLKMYLASYRLEGIFQEKIVQQICNDLVALLQPQFMRVEGKFKPRGGIAINPVATFSKGA